MTSRCHCRIILSSQIPIQSKVAVCDSMEEFLNNLYAWSVLTRLCKDGIFLMSVAVGFLPSLPCAFDLLNTSWMIFPYILTSCCILRTEQIVGSFPKHLSTSSNLLSKYHLFYSHISPFQKPGFHCHDTFLKSIALQIGSLSNEIVLMFLPGPQEIILLV